NDVEVADDDCRRCVRFDGVSICDGRGGVMDCDDGGVVRSRLMPIVDLG
ncbi:unnamed protein product, partial [Didymodactylos carnosus]